MSDEIDWLQNSARWHAFRFGEVERNPSAPGTDLARARSKAHRAFDTIWKLRIMSRTAAYLWLAEKMGLPAHNCHMGMFNAAQCERVVEVVDEFYRERGGRKKRRRR
ncbi:zinc-finger-containing protein [Agrobacterium pusense]|uniref:zinc-finger-containing protein n=1 Tax=Agrobacterium pusense TaxID=648995 RepID=UPI00384C78E6